jgi:hypothetical protein
MNPFQPLRERHRDKLQKPKRVENGLTLYFLTTKVGIAKVPKKITSFDPILPHLEKN